MTTQVLQFTELPAQERRDAALVPHVEAGDQMELLVRLKTGDERTLPVPPSAAIVVEAVLRHLLQGGRVAVLAEDQEVSPNEAAAILGMSRPLVVHRMKVGDLPFRWVGRHRRAKLGDVLSLKTKVDEQQAALAALAADTEDLMRNHGL